MALLFLFLLLWSAGRAEDRQRVSRAHLHFALSLFRELAAEAEENANVIVSPHSVASVLSQLWLGAPEGSSTAKQLENVLHYKSSSLTPEKVHEAFKASFNTLKDPDYHDMVRSASGVFVQAGVRVKKEYADQLRNYYNASIDEVDFLRGESAARSLINRWVREETGGGISGLLEGPLPAHTRLLLVNALSVRGLWNKSFDRAFTASDGTFQGKTQRVKIPMMSGKLPVLIGRSRDVGCRLLELPFRSRRLSLFFLLPDEEETTRLEKNLTANNLRLLFSSLREETVQVRLPRFRISASSPVTETLTRLGITDIFKGGTSDLSKISEENELHVSSMAHKVVLEVREEGATAAAVTATLLERLGTVGEEFFELDRPFLFFIWDYQSGAVLFIGRVANPEPLLD